MAKIIDGKALAEKLQAQLAEKVRKLKDILEKKSKK